MNRTTTDTELYTHGGVLVGEAPDPPGANSTREALALLSPPVLCKTYTNTADGSSQITCQTLTQSGDTYITKINGLSVIVSPSGGTVTWLDDRNLRWYDIHSESVGIAQLLQLARQIIGG